MHTDEQTDDSPQRRQTSRQEVEGRLAAHRELLVKLLSLLATDARTRALLLDWLDERAQVNDNQEDPGAVIVQAFAEQQARADEFEFVARSLRRLVG